MWCSWCFSALSLPTLHSSLPLATHSNHYAATAPSARLQARLLPLSSAHTLEKTEQQMADARQKNTDDKEVPLEKKLDDLYALIEGIEIAMLTTRRPNGDLVSRAMDTQKRAAGADLWFM